MYIVSLLANFSIPPLPSLSSLSPLPPSPSLPLPPSLSSPSPSPPFLSLPCLFPLPPPLSPSHRHKPPVWAATENLTRSVTISQSTNQEEEKESGDTPPTDNMTPHDTPTGDHAASHDKEKDDSAGQQEAVVESASTGGDGGSGDQIASSSARDATSVSNIYLLIRDTFRTYEVSFIWRRSL